jgi:hypothetical protein
MSGGWVGYIYVLVGCGVLVGLVGGSTLLLYAMARVRARRSPGSTAAVTAVPPRREDGADAARRTLDPRS